MAEEMGLSLSVGRGRVKRICKKFDLKMPREEIKNKERKTPIYSEETKNRMRELGKVNGTKNPIQKKDYEIFDRTENGRTQKYIRLPNVHYQNRIVPLRVYIWQQKYGKVEPGYRIDFIDGNPQNCVIENLEMITRKEFFTRPQNLVTDNYAISRLAQGDERMKKELKSHPDLVEIKKASIKLNREIKKALA